MSIPKLKTGAMSALQFKSELRALGYSVYASPKILGVSLRTAQRYAGGESVVPKPVAKLIRFLAWDRELKAHFQMAA